MQEQVAGLQRQLRERGAPGVAAQVEAVPQQVQQAKQRKGGMTLKPVEKVGMSASAIRESCFSTSYNRRSKYMGISPRCPRCGIRGVHRLLVPPGACMRVFVPV